MSKEVDAILHRMNKAAEKIYYDMVNGTKTRYETEEDEGLATEDEGLAT